MERCDGGRWAGRCDEAPYSVSADRFRGCTPQIYYCYPYLLLLQNCHYCYCLFLPLSVAVPAHDMLCIPRLPPRRVIRHRIRDWGSADRASQYNAAQAGVSSVSQRAARAGIRRRSVCAALYVRLSGQTAPPRICCSIPPCRLGTKNQGNGFLERRVDGMRLFRRQTVRQTWPRGRDPPRGPLLARWGGNS